MASLLSRIVLEYDVCKSKFYNQQHKFNNFKDITDEKINEIDELVKNYKELIKPILSSVEDFQKASQEYAQILYVALSDDDLTWDEKMLLVIRYMDPELKLADLYLGMESIRTQTIIEEKDNPFAVKDLIAAKKKKEFELIKKSREAIGIYDVNLLKYELKLYNKLANSLKFNTKSDYTTTFFSSYVTDKTNLDINDNEHTAVKLAARSYKNKYGIPTINDLSYQLLNQSKIIGIRTSHLAMPFMIYVLDSGFKALKIYEENSVWSKINNATKSELGFKCKEFVINEARFIDENPAIAAKLGLKPFK